MSSGGGEPSPAGGRSLGLTDYVFHLFAVVSRHREARLEAGLKPMGLNLSRYRALSVIAGIGPCTMSELADFSAVDRTTLTRTVDQLVDVALVERSTPREDRRQVVLTLTEVGRDVCRRSMRVIFDVNRELTADMSPADQQAAAATLEQLLAKLVPDATLRERLMLRDERTESWARPTQPGA
jgi:MarR family transcriptional regulator, lower aerobic nicotinate degradation pathway regulator